MINAEDPECFVDKMDGCSYNKDDSLIKSRLKETNQYDEIFQKLSDRKFYKQQLF